MEQGAGGPSFCWVCNKQLQRAAGKGLGLFYFHRVFDPKDPDKVPHRIHGDCLKEAKNDGLKMVECVRGEP